MQTAWFRDAMQGQMYALCSYCRCRCFGFEAMADYGAPMIAASGCVAQVDEALCAACATCAGACPFNAIQVNGRAMVDREACLGCGVCAGQCPNGALSQARDEAKGVPLDVRLLVQEVIAGA